MIPHVFPGSSAAEAESGGILRVRFMGEVWGNLGKRKGRPTDQHSLVPNMTKRPSVAVDFRSIA
jgi:hypothetical protein